MVFALPFNHIYRSVREETGLLLPKRPTCLKISWIDFILCIIYGFNFASHPVMVCSHKVFFSIYQFVSLEAIPCIHLHSNSVY